MRKLFVVFAVLGACFAPIAAQAKAVTINVSDIPFETLKTLVPKDKTITIDISGIADDALKVILDKRKTLTVDDADLPTELRNRLQAAQKLAEVTTSLKAAQEWSEMGRGVGVAVREGLSAITDETARFAETTPGKFTMVMIAWKVMGKDFVTTARGLIIGVPLLVVWIGIFLWWLHRVYGYHKMKRVSIDGDGKKTVTYEEMPPLSIQWDKSWVEAQSLLPEKDRGATSDMTVLIYFKTIGFVVVMFLIWWWVI